MKRAVFAFVVIAVVLGLGGLPAGAGAAGHSVRGAGTLGSGESFVFRANGGPSSASGHVKFVFPGGSTLVAPVDCLKVDRHRAVLSGDRSDGQHFWILVVDRGKDPRHPKDAVLSVTIGILPPGSVAPRCTDDLSQQPGFEATRIQRGDVVVT